MLPVAWHKGKINGRDGSGAKEGFNAKFFCEAENFVS
jgi:hypothetical protein